MRTSTFAPAAAIALACVLPGTAHTQTAPLRLWPGVAPGSESWTQKEITYRNTPVGTVVENVVTPTLTAYLPDPRRATGTGIIIAPGGACVALVVDEEGSDVARWLQQRGIAAFVLKYRLMQKRGSGIPKDIDMDAACKYGMADGIRAVAVVRQHAKEFRIAANRVGFMGFSAGGMVASAALLQNDAASRPDFAAFIYGAPFGVMPPIPSNLPPMFMAWAQNDPFALEFITKYYDALKKAGNRPEAHIFSAGSHGFGMKMQHTTSDHWIDEFYYWLQDSGFASPI